MSADNGPQDRDGEGASGISRREVLLTVGGVAAAVGAGAAIWGGLEFFVTKQHTVGSGLNVTYLQVVMVLGTLACVLGVILSIRTARTRFDDVEAARKDVNIGVARVPALVFARLVALMALIDPAGGSRLPRELPYVRRRTRGPRLRELSRDAADGQRHAGSRQRDAGRAPLQEQVRLPRISATTVTVTTASAEASRPR